METPVNGCSFIGVPFVKVVSLLSPIPWALQNILSHQPELTKGIFHDYLTKRHLPEVGLLNPLLQVAAGV